MSHNAIVKVNFSDYTPVVASEKEDRKGWVRYGDDNLFPNYLEEMAQSSPVHGALCTSISQMVAGDGIVGMSEIDQKMMGIDKLLDKTARDLKIQGGFVWELRPSLDGTKIVKIDHLPMTQVRLAKADDDDKVIGVYYSRDWNNARKYEPVFIPIWDGSVSMGKAEDGQPIPRSSAYVSFLNDPASNYYGLPDYWPSINAIELSRQIGIYHVNNILNGLFPAFIVNFLNGIPDEDDKARMIRDWEMHASGARNAGKAYFTFGDPGTTPPQITTFPISDADKQYQFLSEESTRNIMIGHRVVSPLLFGIRDGGGLGSNSDELRQALAIFNAYVIRPMQHLIAEGFESVLNIQGISIKPYQLDLIDSAPKPVQLSEKKKPDLSQEDSDKWLQKLREKGETVDLDEWELVHEDEAGDHALESDLNEKYKSLNSDFMSAASYANGDEKSKWGDAGLYQLRYAYSQNLSADSRPFCVENVALSKAGKVFRYEDIKAMSDDGENGQFAPEGQSTYDIFTWKGGAFCHHFWKRQIYLRKRDANGRILPRKGLENDKRVANVPFVPQKGKEGIAPINTPTRGSLKYG